MADDGIRWDEVLAAVRAASPPLVENARVIHAGLREVRRVNHDLARLRIAAGDDPVVIESELIDVLAGSLSDLDVAGSLHERYADAIIPAIRDAIEGRPLGPCPPFHRPEDFVPAGQHPRFRPIAEEFARLCNEAGDPDDTP